VYKVEKEMKEQIKEDKTKIIINYFLISFFLAVIVFSYLFYKNVAMRKMKNISMLYTFLAM